MILGYSKKTPCPGRNMYIFQVRFNIFYSHWHDSFWKLFNINIFCMFNIEQSKEFFLITLLPLFLVKTLSRRKGIGRGKHYTFLSGRSMVFIAAPRCLPVLSITFESPAKQLRVFRKNLLKEARPFTVGQ